MNLGVTKVYSCRRETENRGDIDGVQSQRSRMLACLPGQSHMGLNFRDRISSLGD